MTTTATLPDGAPAAAEQDEQARQSFDAAFEEAAATPPPAPAAADETKPPPPAGAERGPDGKFVKKDAQPAAEPPPAAAPPPKPASQPPAAGSEPPPAAEPPPKTAEEILAERAAAAAAPPAPAAEEPPPTPPAPPAQPPAATPPPAAVDVLSDQAIADTEITLADGTKAKLGEWGKDYPELLQVSKIIGSNIARTEAKAQAQAMIDAMVKEGKLVEPSRLEAINAKIADFEFWSGVREAHSDCRKVVRSPEFADWLSKQSPAVHKLAASLDPQDGIYILDAFKEHVGKTAAEQAKAKAADAKKKRDDLHGETLRPEGRQKTPVEDKEKDDFDAGFGAT